MVKAGGGGNSVLGRILTIIVLIVFRGGDSLVVGRNNPCAQTGFPMGAAFDFGDLIRLGQVLRGIAHVLNDSQIGLQDRSLGLVACHVGGIGRWIQGDERSVHVARSHGRMGHQPRQEKRQAALQ